MLRFVYFSLFLLTILPNTWAQTKIPEANREDLMKEAMFMLKTFTQLIEDISDKTIDLANRNKSIELANELFIEDAIMQVSSLNRSKTRNYRIPRYLERIRDYPYDKVVMEFFADAVYLNIGSFKKVAGKKDTWKGTGVVTQKFMGTYNSPDKKAFSYDDITEKIITINIIRFTDSSGPRWIVLLGDVLVNETRRD